MEVVFNSGDMESSVMLKQSAELDGLLALRHRVKAGILPEHKSEAHEINITLGGSITVEKHGASGKRVCRTSSAGRLCVTPAGQNIQASWEDDLEIMSLFVDPAFLNRIANENEFSNGYEVVEAFCEEDPLLQHIGLTLINQAESEVMPDRLYTESLVQTFGVHVLKNYTSAIAHVAQKGGLTGYKLRLVIEYINDNLDQDIGLSELAAVAGLSRFHFSRAFRKSTGVTPRKYLTARRMEKAKNLLSSSDIPIVQVGLMTGFKNQSHFTALFRRFTSLTPRHWRQIGQS